MFRETLDLVPGGSSGAGPSVGYALCPLCASVSDIGSSQAHPMARANAVEGSSMPDVLSEAELLAAATGGDLRAFDQLLAVHRDRLWGVCVRTTRNTADAEDALQDCLIAIWQNLAKFRGDSSFSTWIYRIAANAALTVVRKRREIAEIGIEVEDPSRDFVDAFADRDRVQAALMTVPEDFRVALVLREYGQFTYEEIAEHQGILVATVKTRISRARAAVAAALIDEAAER